MDATLQTYRALVAELGEYEGEQVYAEILAPWVAENGGEVEWLAALAARPGTPFPPVSSGELHRLASLGRVFDALLNQFQLTDSDDPSASGWLSDGLTVPEFVSFAEALGLTAVGEEPFAPFLHEIVSAETSAEAGEPIAVVGSLWPALMLGEMLVLRGGVRVRGGSDHLDPGLAAQSPLYWSHTRPHRRCVEPPAGRGVFRRDYRIGETEYLNVDAADDATHLGPGDGRYWELPPEGWVELVRHRCNIKALSEDASVDLDPFDLRLTLYPPPHLPRD